MSIFEGLRDYFWKFDVILGWPRIYGTRMCENWNFAPGPENYHFALGPYTGNSEFWKILGYLWDESGLKIRSIIGLWTFLPFNYWIDTNKGRRIKGKIGNRVGSRHVSPQQPLYLTSSLSPLIF